MFISQQFSSKFFTLLLKSNFDSILFCNLVNLICQLHFAQIQTITFGSDFLDRAEKKHIRIQKRLTTLLAFEMNPK